MRKAPLVIAIVVIVALAAGVVMLVNEKQDLTEQINAQARIQDEQARQLLSNAGEQANLSQQMAELDQQNQLLKDELEDDKARFAEMRTEADELRRKIETIQADYLQKTEAAQKEIIMLSGIQQELNNQLANTKKDTQNTVNALQEAVEKAEKAQREAQERLNAAAEENAGLRSALETAKAENAALTEALEDVSMDGTSSIALQSELKAAIAENTALTEKLNAMKAENTVLSSLQPQLEAALAENAALKTGGADTEALRSALEKAQAENASLTAALAAAQSGVSDEEATALKNRADELSRQVAEAQQTLSQLKTDNDELRNTVAALTKSNDEQARAISEMSTNSRQVAMLTVVCENKYHKKTYFKVTPEEALSITVPAGTIYIQVQLFDAAGNLLSVVGP